MELPDNLPVSRDHSPCETLLQLLHARHVQEAPHLLQDVLIANLSSLVLPGLKLEVSKIEDRGEDGPDCVDGLLREAEPLHGGADLGVLLSPS